MDDTISGVLIGGGIALVTQVVAHGLQRRTRVADEIRRVAPEFVETVYRLKLMLDEVTSYLTGLITGATPDEVDDVVGRKAAALAEEVTIDRLTELSVRLWRVQIACGANAADTAERIVEHLRKYFREFKIVQAFKRQGSFKAMHEHGDLCSEHSKEIEGLLRRFADEMRALVGYRPGGI